MPRDFKSPALYVDPWRETVREQLMWLMPKGVELDAVAFESAEGGLSLLPCEPKAIRP